DVPRGTWRGRLQPRYQMFALVTSVVRRAEVPDPGCVAGGQLSLRFEVQAPPGDAGPDAVDLATPPQQDAARRRQARREAGENAIPSAHGAHREDVDRLEVAEVGGTLDLS